MPDTKIGAAYIRASTEDQLEYSPDSQIKAVRDFARREGYVIPEEYVYQDDGISGKAADKRPAFRLMIAQAKEDAPPFDAIFVWEFSRFARNQEESILYKNLLRKRGIAVKSVREPLADSPFASLIERIIEWMDEYYLINLAIEVRRGMAEKAARGEAMGNAPFGYTCKNKTFVPNGDAKTVRWIFAQYAGGMGCRAIAAQLNAQGVRTRRGHPPDNRFVLYMLKNPVYIGKIRWSTDGHANYTRAGERLENVLLAEGKHAPIIDRAMWDAVQKRLAEKPTEIKYRRSGSKIFMLKGLLRCGDCGAVLSLTAAEPPSVQCHRYARGQCAVSHSITIKKADQLVISYLEGIVKAREYRFIPATPPRRTISRDWDKLIAAERARLSRARDALLDGAFTPKEYREAKAAIEETIAKLTAGRQAEEASDTPAASDSITPKVRAVMDIIRSPKVSEATKNEAMRGIIDRIVLHRPGNLLDFYFLP